MRTVHEVSALTGVSVRTLHHYDAVGLLKPTEVTKAGYRLYDEEALRRLQVILMFRELRFPLKEIKAMLESPEFNRKEALAQQIRLLELQRKHIDGLIAYAREIQEKGVQEMEFSAFRKTEFDQYAEEVRERWGSTKAYQEYRQKTKGKTAGEMEAAAGKMMGLFAEIGALGSCGPEDEKVQEKIRELQDFITANYYHCTDEILRGLGQMYVEDERMKRNIDKAGGEGTAEFVSRAISFYSRRFSQ